MKLSQLFNEIIYSKSDIDNVRTVLKEHIIPNIPVYYGYTIFVDSLKNMVFKYINDHQKEYMSYNPMLDDLMMKLDKLDNNLIIMVDE